MTKEKSPDALARSVAPLVVSNDILSQGNDTTHGSPNQAQEFSERDELVTRFAPKRESSLRLAEAYGRLGYVRRSERVAECGTFLEFAHEVQDGQVAQKGKLHNANFCRDRLCPMCSWRRSYKVFAQVSKIMDCIVTDYKFLFLTLTVRNVSGDELRPTISRMMEAWNRYTGYTDIKAILRGYFRALEITHNKKTDTYHPHIHAILAVPKRYGNGQCYIKRAEWLRMWQKAYRDPLITQVDIRVARAKDSREQSAAEQKMSEELSSRLASAIAEIAKYPIKETDLSSDKVVYYLANALHGRRLVAFGGIFKDMHQFLKMDDAEAERADLVHIGEKLNPSVLLLICRYGWSAGVYKLVSQRAEHTGSGMILRSDCETRERPPARL